MKIQIKKIIFTSLVLIGASTAKAEKIPIFVPLSQTDLDDPQVGYIHASLGMKSGTFFFSKRGESRVDKTKKVELDRFTFSKNTQREVIPGFIPRYAACTFNNKWACFIFSSRKDVIPGLNELYTANPQSTNKIDILFCEDCKPIPDPGLVRTCPGFYQDILDGGEFKDRSIPTYPEFFTEDGDCIYEKPWVVSSNEKNKEEN